MLLASYAPTVNSAGISSPSYADILDTLQTAYRNIYGQDIYLGSDSQDGQWLGLIAQAIFDCGQVSVAVFNQYSPATAIGAGLSSVVKINGIARRVPTNSQVALTLVGQSETEIIDGQVGDDQHLGTVWLLPNVVTIPVSGTITVTAVCSAPGAITAQTGTLTNILTPVPGWQTVTNAQQAAPGAPVESDAQLRLRQSRSAALPAATTLDGIFAAVAAVPGVLRLQAYQNDTEFTNADGLPAHNISIVVEGGDVNAVAKAIQIKKPPGIPTFGTTTVTVLDSRGMPDVINFYELGLFTMSALVIGTPISPNYLVTTAGLVQQAVAQYLNTLEIGQDVEIGDVYSPAKLNGADAVAATGLTQAELDVIAQTYKLDMPFAVALGRSDMSVSAGGGSGANSVTIVNGSFVVIGNPVFFALDDLTFFMTFVTNLVGNTLSFSPAIPGGRNVVIGSVYYVVNDIPMNFHQSSFVPPDLSTVHIVIA